MGNKPPRKGWDSWKAKCLPGWGLGPWAIPGSHKVTLGESRGRLERRGRARPRLWKRTSGQDTLQALPPYWSQKPSGDEVDLVLSGRGLAPLLRPVQPALGLAAVRLCPSLHGKMQRRKRGFWFSDYQNTAPTLFSPASEFFSLYWADCSPPPPAPNTHSFPLPPVLHPRPGNFTFSINWQGGGRREILHFISYCPLRK